MPSEDGSVDHYAALQLRPNAQASEIKTSYRKLALLYHPDRNHGNEAEANRKFQAIQAAYEVLNDSTRRAKYDRARAAAGYSAVSSTASASKNTASTASTTAAAGTTTSNTARRYTSTAGYTASMKSENRGADFKNWASGGYNKSGYRSDDKSKSTRESDDDKKRREQREREERARSSRGDPSRSSTRAKDYVRPDSPHTPRRAKESAYAHYTSRSSRHAEDTRSRGRSPEPSSTRTSGAHNDSDQDTSFYGRSWSRPYAHIPHDKFTLRPDSPIPEARPTTEPRYSRQHDTHYYSSSQDKERYNRSSAYAESKKSKSGESERHVPPPSPPPEKERSSKYSHTFVDINGEETGKRHGRRSPSDPSWHKKSSSTGAYTNWSRPYVENEEDSEGVQADDEKTAEEKTFEERMRNLNFGETRDAKHKKKGSGSWEGLKEKSKAAHTSNFTPETPRRTPSPIAIATPSQSPKPEKKKESTQEAAPQPPPSVFEFQIPQAPSDIPPNVGAPTFSWSTAFAQPQPFAAPPPAPFGNYAQRTPVFAQPHPFNPQNPPQTAYHPFARPASTQPTSATHSAYRQPPSFSQYDLNKMYETLHPANGVSSKKSEPSLRNRGRTRSKGSKPTLTTKFAQMRVSENNSPVKEDDGSDASKKDESSAKEGVKINNKTEDTNSSAMDIDPPTTPQPASTFQAPPKPTVESVPNGKPKASDFKTATPAPATNGFAKPSTKPDPFMFHNLANTYPINAAEILGGLNGMAQLKESLPSFKTQPSPTVFETKSSTDASPFPQPPKPPTLTLLDASGKLDMTAHNPYWDSMQVYVEQWREYEAKMAALLQAKLAANVLDYADLLSDVKKARGYHAKAREEKALREEWTNQQSKFVATIIEYHQLKACGGIITPPVASASNTSFLGTFTKSKVFPNLAAGFGTGIPGTTTGTTTTTGTASASTPTTTPATATT